ncbi:uncharacterized protein LOC125900032 isoform X9 [Epinephelus fuscoguttatus]|uniref:uncharacterized protein LOC125900032 isoform X9 n=1 Tax=Epinephelus fuscoguttatus TaxID=293821 RepID=UPI0020D12901|nr:uncharacterized protein LOC125900032 isoform X9 [Epinephelus fuscoguttatus]
MISLTGAALFLIQLLVVCQVFADILPQIPSFDQRNILVPRGDSITLTCNISMANVTQINWTKGRSVFAHSVLLNQTITNFTSHYIIDVNLPSKLNISNVQHDDAGLYRCDLTDIKGQRTIEWNLTVSEKPEGTSPSWFVLYTLTAVIGSLLCLLTPAVCLSRKNWTKTQNQDQDSRTLSCAQYQAQLGREVAPLQPHSCAEYRTNHQQRESVLQEAQYEAE